MGNFHEFEHVFPKEERNLENEKSEFIQERLQRTWKSLGIFHQGETGFPADRLAFAPSELKIGLQTKPTNIGLSILCLLTAEKLGLITSLEAQRHLQLILDSLKKLERHQGFFYDWYDSKSGAKLEKWPDGGNAVNLFLSSIDNAWLALSLLILQKCLPDLKDQIQTDFLSHMNFDFFFDPDAGETRGGYSVSQQAFTDYHYSRQTVSEVRIIPWVQAAMVENENEKNVIMQRTLDQGGEVPKALAGGALFELLLPRIFVDEPKLDPVVHDLFDLHRRYGQTFGDFVGISVADNPNDNDRYSERGVGGYYPNEPVLSSHGMALALLMDPLLALRSLQAMEEVAGFYGENGYMDAVDAQKRTVTQTQVFIDQAMVFLSLFSYKDNYLKKLFMSYDQSKGFELH